MSLPLLGLVGCAEAPALALGVSTSATFMDAARMALSDAASAGLELHLDTVMIPEATNAATPAVVAAQRFTEHVGLVAVVGHSNSSASLAASQIYNDAGILQLAPQSSARAYSDAGPFSFRLVPPDDRQAGYLVRHLEESFPAGATVATIHVNDDYGRGLRRALDSALANGPIRQGLVIPYAEEQVTEVDIAHAAGALGAARPDAIVWLGRATSLDRYLPAIRSAVPGVPIVGVDALASAPQLNGRRGDWTGVRHVDFLDLDSDPRLRQFAERYRERFGRPATAPDALTYDAVALILTAMGEGATTGEALRFYLLSLGRARPPYQGITGPIQFDESGNVARSYVMRSVP
jgi:branched-chain amino acid transport system substrate-binding protein